MSLIKSVSVFVFALVLLAIPQVAFAKTSYSTVKPVVTVEPTPTPTPVEQVSSFELFWPMVAGKTVQSKLYVLKTLKESLRGIFIFGKAQKADYQVFLGVKRMLEAEALINANDNESVGKTLGAATSNFENAVSDIDSAKLDGDIAKDVKDGINVRMISLKKLTTFLISNHSDYKDGLQTVLDKLNLITSKI